MHDIFDDDSLEIGRHDEKQFGTLRVTSNSENIKNKIKLLVSQRKQKQKNKKFKKDKSDSMRVVGVVSRLKLA